MKILHTADWHLGAYVGPQCDDPYGRMDNTIKCLDALVETARREQPDIILVAGDIFHSARTWNDRAMQEYRVAIDYLSALGRVAPVMVLLGTLNHDPIQSFYALEEHFMGSKYPYVRFFTEPALITVSAKSGPIQIAGLPGFDKGHFRAQFPGLSAEEENQIFSEQLSQIVQGLSAQVDATIPSVLIAHHTVVGCELDNGQHVFQANEVVLDAAALDNSSFDLVCLGHIHKAQRVVNCNKPVYYAGSIDAFTFNDEGREKGFAIHEIEQGKYYRSIFNMTPAREFATVNWNQTTLQCYIANGMMAFDLTQDPWKNKIVRILYSCDSEMEKALDKKKLERDLYAAGAYYVSEIRPEKIEASVNREKLHEKLTVADCLDRYLIEKKYNEEEISQYMCEAVDIVADANAKSAIGGQTGIFMPIEISVRNYRSYAEETLNFRDIYFAMVNGRNGSGKSSLFMDAIVDCLYEQPREGDLTGWIRSGEKSGSISFTFQLGLDEYRVTRTRQRSGKATLALAFDSLLGPGGPIWEDISCQKLVDTQEKIIQLLGMDADTFRSCVLIMQDQYGRFMEAKPEDRMSVLASLLGLGIYEQLEEETKARLTDVNRELKKAKDEMLQLESHVSQFDTLQTEKDSLDVDINATQFTLDTLKHQHDETTSKVATMDQKAKEREGILQGVNRNESLRKSKNLKMDELSQHAAQTREFLANEEYLNQQHNQLQQIKEKILAMDGTVKLVGDKQMRSVELHKEVMTLMFEKTDLEKKMQIIKQKLQGLETIEAEIKQLEGCEEELQLQDEKKSQRDELTKTIMMVESKLAQNSNSIKIFESQAAILKNANCIDLENAKCGFLKAAKEAVERINHLSDIGNQIQKEYDSLLADRTALSYDPFVHSNAKTAADKYRRLKQQLATLEGDKKLLEVHTKRYEDIGAEIGVKQTSEQCLKTEIEVLQLQVSDYDTLKKQKLEYEKSEEQWQQLPQAKAYLESVLPQIDELGKEIKALYAEIHEAEEKAAILAQQLQDAYKYWDALKALKQSISEYEASLMDKQKRLGSLEEKLAVLNGKRLALHELKEEIAQMAGQVSRLQVLSEAFGRDGIPHQIVRDIIPELEASANEILGQMTGGRMRLEFRTERTLKSNKAKEVATLDIVIIDVDHGELPYLSRSGGQKVRAALATNIALTRLKASRVGLQLGMMFIDEPPFLDAEGVESYCSALQVTHEMYPEMRVVSISHDENMKNAFPQQLYVEMTNNGSKVLKGR